MNHRLEEAIQLHRRGTLEEAHAIYTEVLNAEPKADVLYLIGLLLFQYGKHLEAVQFMSYAVRLNKEEPLYPFATGYFAQELGWEEQCEQAYQQALVLKPDFAVGFSNLGWFYTQTNRYDEAMRCYRAAVNLSSQTYAAYLGLAVTLKRMGLDGDALDGLGIALTLRPDIAVDGEEPAQTLQRIESARPILYQPPVMLTGERAQRKAPAVARAKPKLRILHQLPMSGGALISRCLASLPDVCVFNNIHPRNAEVQGYGENVFRQADSWFHLFSSEDKGKLAGQSVGFAEGMRMIADRVEAQGKVMVLRCWSYLDFLGKPFVAEASMRAELAEALREDFQLIEAATVRHPLENWHNLLQLPIIKGQLDAEAFLRGYRAFAHYAEKVGYVRHEDFMREPDGVLQKLCGLLELPFDTAYRERWKFESRISPEPEDPTEFIAPLPQGVFDTALLEAFEANFDYWPVLKQLAYEHPEPSTQYS